jgi:hypothetical protein
MHLSPWVVHLFSVHVCSLIFVVHNINKLRKVTMRSIAMLRVDFCSCECKLERLFFRGSSSELA